MIMEENDDETPSEKVGQSLEEPTHLGSNGGEDYCLAEHGDVDDGGNYYCVCYDENTLV